VKIASVVSPASLGHPLETWVRSRGSRRWLGPETHTGFPSGIVQASRRAGLWSRTGGLGVWSVL